MEERNWQQSMPPDPHDMTKYVEFGHVIGVAMRNNCHFAEWRSWKYVPVDVRKVVMDQLLVIDEVDEGGVEEGLQIVAL
ncbi:hypothetical protein D8674_025646 [Pyrus ussuriensis x Pyrus communis]|uniref:Uncharacterized protein n=1 Tax=Pyrus ussuriensis x Pyrus communis TaxID=2448454 RepID=A0A5N5I9G9_9ROSA|nr:hypothetical protein D8674_025646 [Pyrus ussuriensis x Pyrus communis]